MLQWKNIDTILLDMDGTLLDLNFDNHFWQHYVPQCYAQLNNISQHEAVSRLVPIFKAKEGTLDWYCVDYWSNELQLDIVALKNELVNLIAILPHVTDFLELLSRSNKQVLLVTNAHQDTLKLKMQKTCLQDFFDGIVCSHEVGAPKEQHDFWEHLQQCHGFLNSRTLLVDDSLPVLNAARQYGIAHLIAISKPDSTQPARQLENYRAIADFRELMPGL